MLGKMCLEVRMDIIRFKEIALGYGLIPAIILRLYI